MKKKITSLEERKNIKIHKMNSTSNYTDSSSYESLFLALGVDRLLDSLYLYLNTIVSGIGFILNILSFAVFMDKEFDIPLYRYLRVYTINSAVGCLFFSSLFTALSASYFSWTYSYPAAFYCTYIFLPIANTGYFYGTILDLIITMDRISNFYKPVKKIFILGPYKMCTLILMFCFVTNIPDFLHYSASVFISTVNQTHVVAFWHISWSSFTFTPVGGVLVIMNAVFRDLFLMLVEFAVNVVSIFCLKKYFKNRAKLLIAERTRTNNAGTNIEGNNNTTNMAPQVVTSHETYNVMSSANLRATYMTVVICSLSLLEHMALISCVVSQFFNISLLASDYVCFGGNFSIGLKHSVNFFIFYIFNKKFSTKLHRLFKF
jgi:hypothetical protein